MDREKKIAFIKGQLRNAEDDLNEAIVQKDDYFATRIEYFVSLLKRELKLLSLPKRTIETLEVGDYVEVKFLDAFLGEAHDFPEVLQGVVNVRHTWLGVGGWEFDYDDILDITIIPHEALTLLKELMGNERI